MFSSLVTSNHIEENNPINNISFTLFHIYSFLHLLNYISLIVTSYPLALCLSQINPFHIDNIIPVSYLFNLIYSLLSSTSAKVHICPLYLMRHVRDGGQNYQTPVDVWVIHTLINLG